MMRKTATATAVAAMASAQPLAADEHETRCGWYRHDAPYLGDYVFEDADGEWALADTKGFTAQGFYEHKPEFSDDQWVSTSSDGHGFGCVCLAGEFRDGTLVTEVRALKVMPLAHCRTELNMPDPDVPK